MPNRSDRPLPRDGVAWITGASTGIGRALALRLARDGWTVAATARSQDGLATLAAQAPGRIVPFPGDVTAEGAPAAIVAAVERDIGPIALCVVSAGMHEADRAFGLDLAAFRRVIDLNIVAAIACGSAAADRMRPRGLGQIALIASLAGYRGLPGAIAYSGSKAALIAMAEAMAFDLAPAGIGIQIVNPGFVRTPLTDGVGYPMPFLMDADRAADRIARGLRSGRFEIAFPVPLVMAMKLARLLPPRLYIALARRATRRRAR